MLPSTPDIRPEAPEDLHAIRSLLLAAFPSDAEAAVVDDLRSANALPVSLVAFDSDQTVGHIGFSPVTLRPQPHNPCMVLGLAPLCVAPDAQRRGIGSALVAAGLRACAGIRCDAVVVLGDPVFYRRFGFRPAAAQGLRCLFDAPQEAFMVWQAPWGALPIHEATVHFHAAFNRFLGSGNLGH
ncbi:MAG: N-acetyltransferase [Verrucomicrobiales bacterium]|nr:N-acetyltransferase [Verrucomicrobiales bacterium]